MSLTVWNLQKKKDEVLYMLSQLTKICFSEPNYVTLHSIINIMTENSTIMTHNMPQQWFQAITIWNLSEKCYCKPTMTDVVVWLSCYVFIFAIWNCLTTVNLCLRIFFFQKLSVIGKISIRWSEKKHKTIDKVEM